MGILTNRILKNAKRNQPLPNQAEEPMFRGAIHGTRHEEQSDRTQFRDHITGESPDREFLSSALSLTAHFHRPLRKSMKRRRESFPPVIKRGDLDEKPGATLLLHDLPGVEAERVLLVSLGKRSEFERKSFSRCAQQCIAKILATGVAKDAAVTLADVDVPGRSHRLARAAGEPAACRWRISLRCSRDQEPTKKERGVRKITLLTSEKVDDKIRTAVRRGQAIAEGVALAKDLGNLPGNVCHPPYLAEIAPGSG